MNKTSGNNLDTKALKLEQEQTIIKGLIKQSCEIFD